VPFALQKPLKTELDRMESLNVIEKIDEPTDWVSSLVIVEKKNGKPSVYGSQKLEQSNKKRNTSNFPQEKK
jgi:hypothetical protein